MLDRSIGGVALGMQRATVVARYGRPDRQLEIVLESGPPGLLVRYRLHGGLLYVTYDAEGRVVGVETTSPYYRTRGGVGVGRLIARADALRGFEEDSCTFGVWNGARPQAVVTAFTRRSDRVASVWIVRRALYSACSVETTFPPEPPRPPRFEVVVSVDAPGSGWVRSDPYLLDCPEACVRPADDGSRLRFEAHPTRGFTFVGWGGDCMGTGICELVVDGDKTVVARFTGRFEPEPEPEEEPSPGGEGGTE